MASKILEEFNTDDYNVVRAQVKKETKKWWRCDMVVSHLYAVDLMRYELNFYSLSYLRPSLLSDSTSSPTLSFYP